MYLINVCKVRLYTRRYSATTYCAGEYSWETTTAANRRQFAKKGKDGSNWD